VSHFLQKMSHVVFLVSYATPPSALGTVDVKVFRHDFINIFRFSENRTLHPNDINFIEQIEADCIRYEEDNETVFLSRATMDRMRKLIDPRKTMGQTVVKFRRRVDSGLGIAVS